MRIKLVGGNESLTFKCPGCDDHHTVPIVGPRAWGFNGDLERPTLTPSILVRSGHYAPSHAAGEPCWCGTDYGFNCYQCHSVITDGRIAFCSDCSHEHAGKTLDLLDVAP